MPKYTHKERPITELAPVGLEVLITTRKLPPDEEQEKATLDFIKKYTIEQGDLYTATFKDLNFQEQALSINGQIRALAQAIQAHVDRADDEAKEGKERNPHETWTKCIEQVGRLCIEQLAALRTRLEEDRQRR